MELTGASADSWYPLTCSDGVWDPEKWHASLYPASGRSSPVESLKKELDTDRPSLARRIVGEHTQSPTSGRSSFRVSFAAGFILSCEDFKHGEIFIIRKLMYQSDFSWLEE